MDRETLEKQAMEAVCGCWAYDLANCIEETDDETLQHIIDDPQYCHKQAQEYNPIAVEEYEKELRECPCAPKVAA